MKKVTNLIIAVFVGGIISNSYAETGKAPEATKKTVVVEKAPESEKVPQKAVYYLPCGARMTKCIIKEDQDQDIKINLRGYSKNDFQVKVIGPEKKMIVNQKVKAEKYAPLEIVIPKDGQTGQYVIMFVNLFEHKSKIEVPLTDLPEVYPTKYWAQSNKYDFFVKPVEGESMKFTFRPNKSSALVVDAVDGKILAKGTGGIEFEAEVGKNGAWIKTKARYNISKQQIVLSVSPEKWFAPETNESKK